MSEPGMVAVSIRRAILIGGGRERYLIGTSVSYARTETRVRVAREHFADGRIE